MTFPVTGAEPYTDEDFKAMTDESHHQGLTSLSVLPVGLSGSGSVVHCTVLPMVLVGCLHLVFRPCQIN